jgi:hypothetical protein
MNFDYCELELVEAEGGDRHLVAVGCRFEDEPDELYVIHLIVNRQGGIEELKLYFNGHDCKYTFKPEELAALKEYVEQARTAADSADWPDRSIVWP